MIEAIVVAVAGGLLVALAGNLTLDLLRGVPGRIDGRLERLLREVAREDRDRWREELHGVLREFEGRPLKQWRESREIIRAAEELSEIYRVPVERRISPAVAREPEDVDAKAVWPEGLMFDLRREFLKAAAEFLSYRELRVLELRHGLGGKPPETAESVGRKFNVVPEAIDRIERQAIMKIESIAEAQKLREIPPPSIGRDD